MENGESKNVYEVYNTIAAWFSENRNNELTEKKYLDDLISHIPIGGSVLDVGCGTGRPVLEYLISQNLEVTGVDASVQILAIARANFPSTRFIQQDMRNLDMHTRFDAIIAWNSFFHLPAADQPAMFKRFKKHLNPNGILLLTSGTENGEAWGMNGGENLFHASLDTEEYKVLLKAHDFAILEHIVNDPDCGYATVWMAQYVPNR